MAETAYEKEESEGKSDQSAGKVNNNQPDKWGCDLTGHYSSVIVNYGLQPFNGSRLKVSE